MANELKVGIAGYGVVGKRRREVIDLHPDLKTVAVCDRKMVGLNTLTNGVKCFDNYWQLLDEDLDILFVCLTNDIAAEVTIAGLEKGCHVFCEKPPGRDLADMAKILACESSHPSQKLKYGFNHRYHDSVKDALAIVQSKDLGKVINLRGVYGKSRIINFESEWRTQRNIAGGGILLDQGIHLVDLMRLFGGDYKEFHSFISNSYWDHDVEDNAYAIMRTTDGVIAMLHSTATQWRHHFSLDITLEEGFISLSGLLTGSKSYGAETMTVAEKTEHDRGDPREQTTRYNADPSWGDEVTDFAAAIRDDRPIAEGSSADALATMQHVFNIYCADPDWRDRWSINQDLPQFD